MTNEIFTKYGNNPIDLYQQWLDEASTREPNDPNAVCLATVNAQGKPSNRFLLIKDVSEEGFKFHTHENSAKGQDIAENSHVAFTVYWKSTRKQIRVTGLCSSIPDTESDAYFKTRPRARAIGTWASTQSQRFDKREELDQAIQNANNRFTDETDIPRPPGWKGYRIVPETIEFWIGNRDRLHTRFIYEKNGEQWITSWLFP